MDTDGTNNTDSSEETKPKRKTTRSSSRKTTRKSTSENTADTVKDSAKDEATHADAVNNDPNSETTDANDASANDASANDAGATGASDTKKRRSSSRRGKRGSNTDSSDSDTISTDSSNADSGNNTNDDAAVEATSDDNDATNDDASDNTNDNNANRKSRSKRSKNSDSESSDSEGGSSNRRKNNKRKNSQRNQLNYRDLQSKIIPELHLLAKEVGLEEYRTMSKDDLAVAILERSAESDGLKLVSGFLEISSDGYGFLQESMLQNNTRSVIVSAGLIKQFKLRTGDHILGKSRRPRENERYGTLIRVEAVNNSDPFLVAKRPRFDDLVPTFPEKRIRLETSQNEVATRVIDLLAPIGRGQRGLIVAPPKAGKTTLLKKVANAVVSNETDITVIVLLVDERPEEVTDFRESVHGVEVVASTFDEPPTNHIRVAEFVHERARRIVEDGGHVMILLDSITRLARANNLVTPPTGRTLSGGLDSSALHWPKRFLGAARNIRGGGSLSILATALIETGSRMDDVIFEEFKGTGNMELHLSRRLEEKRIFPAIDILKSGTRREDLLLGEETLAKMWLLRKVISDMDSAEAMDMLLSRLNRTKSNDEFLSTLAQG
jgi:transcription termination factor Rho